MSQNKGIRKTTESEVPSLVIPTLTYFFSPKKRKKILYKQAQRKISTDYWIKYKSTSAILHQIIKESKRKFWDEGRQETWDANLIFKVFRKLRSRPTLTLILFWMLMGILWWMLLPLVHMMVMTLFPYHKDVLEIFS